MKRVRVRGKNAASGGRDWSRVDWTKTNTQLAKELGVVRGTVHSQRKRYAPESLLYKHYDPNPEPTTLADPPAPKEEVVTTVTTTVANAPQAPNDVIVIKHHPARHWSAAPAKPRVPRDPMQYRQIAVKAGDQVVTLGMLRDALQHDTLTSIELANALQLRWDRDLHAAFEAFVDLGPIVGAHEVTQRAVGETIERTYAWRTVPREEGDGA